MKTFEISVKDKIAVLTNREMYVCGNSDFVVDFSFDAEWDAFDTKTARFAYKGTYQDQVFHGNQCPVPIIHDTQIIMVGVFAGNLHTTTAACIGAKRSILSGSGVPADPAPDVYAQIMELIQGLGDPDPETIAAAVADYIRQNPIEESDPTVPAWAKQPTKPAYTAAEVGALPDTYTPPNQTAQQVGADPAGTATTAVSQHNVDTAAHNDLRLSLQELATRVNTALDSDDTTLDQMSEVVAYIKSNKTLIDSITTSKVSVSDIVNDLVTNAADKPLSAAQGVVIKTLIDALRNDKLDAAELTNAVNTALAQAKESGEFDGQDGATPNIQIGTVETLAAGSPATASMGGTPENPILNLGIPKGDAGNTPVKGTDYFTEADKQEIAEQAAGLVSIPNKLPNPNALTFTGAVTGSYDGSAPLSVEIPQGGGGGGALAGLTIADNYDIELISHVIIDQDNIPTAGITVTQKDDGSPFAYDGLLIWTDARSAASYTTFNFNGYTNYPITMKHGDARFLNMYITDGTTMSIITDSIRNIIKQSYADTGNLFFPDAPFQRVPEKFTSFKIGADGIASVTFYKAWGLTRK